MNAAWPITLQSVGTSRPKMQEAAYEMLQPMLGVHLYHQIPSLISFLFKNSMSIIKKLSITKTRFYNSFFRCQTSRFIKLLLCPNFFQDQVYFYESTQLVRYISSWMTHGQEQQSSILLSCNSNFPCGILETGQTEFILYPCCGALSFSSNFMNER